METIPTNFQPMTPEQLEILALNRELGEAEGLLEAFAVNHKRSLTDSHLACIKHHLEKVENRKSHLE